MTSSQQPPGLARFNSARDEAALTALRAVCASSAWAGRLLSLRPYATAEALTAAGDRATAALTPADLAEAVAAHPPIGRPSPGDATAAREQAGMAGAPAELRAEVLALNLAYQEKFGHVFLICATGLSGEQLRDALRTRTGHTPEHERGIVRAELGKINRIRLARLVAEPAAEEE